MGPSLANHGFRPMPPWARVVASDTNGCHAQLPRGRIALRTGLRTEDASPAGKPAPVSAVPETGPADLAPTQSRTRLSRSRWLFCLALRSVLKPWGVEALAG